MRCDLRFVAAVLLLISVRSFADDLAGVVPVGDDGKPLNLGFEDGTLKDWKAEGSAFDGQPIKGDTVAKRRPNHSQHNGEYWIGTYEVAGDGPRGNLTSVPFKVTHPWASFLVGGGDVDQSVDVRAADTNAMIFHARGRDREEMDRVAVDLHEYVGKRIYIRLVDDNMGGWGHINYDDFRFHATEPKFPKRAELTPDATANAGLAPADAVKAITLPPGFKATLFAGEPDVNQPVGFCIDDRGRLWVAEAYTYPVRAPEGQGKDRILIFEDTDGDGKFDKRTVFIEGLNLVSGIEVGFGGVWVGAAPYLLFIPDKDHDDKPDAEPQVLLDGWAYQDTHETLNAFTWGPDGWLYGCHGVFTQSLVGKPGTPKEDRVPLNAGVWRYHPTRHVFEVFAEGSSNPWGVDFNDRGQAFITACVIPHLYHVIEGGHYFRQAGNHFNPYVYQDITTIADHVHWLGDQGPHAGNNKSAAAGGGHAHCGAMIYLADSWPAEYRDSLFMANIHGNRFNNDALVPSGSGYLGTHRPDPILMNDRWSRLINLKYGPDGSVYAIDWYDKQACHMTNPEIWDRTNGRIYKFVYNDQPAVKVDLASQSNEQLADLMLSKNDWYVRHARRLLQERNAGPEVAPKLASMLSNDDVTRRLRALWALHCTGALTRDLVAQALKDTDPYMRGWAIQLAAESFGPMNLTNWNAPRPENSPQAGEYVSSFAEMAKSDASPIVRLYLASAAQRIPVAQRGPVVEALLAHAEDIADHNLPLMDWYAAEAIVGADIARGVELAKKCAIPLVRELIARRICAEAVKLAGGDVNKVNPAPLAALTSLLAESNDPALQRDALAGMQAGLAGWQTLPMPENWSAIAQKLAASDNPDVRSLSQAISVVFGEEHAMAALRRVIPDAQQSAQARRDAITALVGAKDRALAPILQGLLNDPAVCSAALRGLAAFDDPSTPAAIVQAYPSMRAENRLEALNTLASRVEYARAFKSAMEAGVIARADVSAATLRQLGSLESEEIKSFVASTFGQVRQTPAEKQKQITQLVDSIGRSIDRADASNGRALFAKTCMQCHVLFDTGGKVGPDLTGSNRADLNYLFSNIVDPSAVIAKEYLVSIIRLGDGRVISGIVKADDGNAISVRTESELLTIPKSQLVRQTQQSISMMPEGLIAAMSPDELRDLAGYLRSPKQVLMLATKYNANSFFNGRDLTGWSGDPSLWKVEDGQIVGRTAGLAKNQFLFSDLLAGDFRLTLKIRLVANAGNSGVQFRSESLPDGEARGYQADVGEGWWGKLYEENGRALLVKEGGEQWVKKDDWNDYEITATGSKIHTSLNGHACVDFDDPDGARRGRIGFQLHSGGATEVRLKEIKLEVR